MKKEDLRVKKTKLNLYNGLLELMKEKPFETIKVSDICNKSLINRSTFYDHFSDKYELFESYIEYLGHTLEEELNANQNTKDFYLEHLGLLIDEINSKIDIYKAIFNNNYNSITKDMILAASIKNILQHLDDDYKLKDKETTRLKVLFYVSGVIAIISDNIRTNNQLNKEELVILFEEFIPGFNKEKK